MSKQVCQAPFWAHYIRSVCIPTLEALTRCLLDRLLPTFAAVEQEADRVYHDYDPPFFGDPEDFDFGDVEEGALDAYHNYYATMKDVEQGLINLYTVGLWHALEQQLLFIHRRELLGELPGEKSNPKLLTLEEIKKRLKDAGVDVGGFPSWERIRELQLLAHTVKHADGPSCEKLKTIRPELFSPPPRVPENTAPSLCWVEKAPVYQPLAGGQVYVTRSRYEEYAEAAIQFLRELAEALEHPDQ